MRGGERYAGVGQGRPDLPDAAAADADAAAAVGRVLEALLAERVADAARVDARYARDVAERIAGFTLTGGKRLRPQFLWWAYRGCGGVSGDDAGRALRTAAALELLQTAALVHDDVMDDSGLRRGRPALHADFAAQYPSAPGPGTPFGAAAAVLGGDLALAWADDVVAETALPPAVRGGLLRVWREMRGDMVAGQYLDLHAQVTGARSTARAVRTAYLKGAVYTVERPLQLGATLAGADGEVVRALRLAGRCAGLAFQFRDDLLGAFGDPRDTGKPSGADIRQGKLTLLVAVAYARAAAEGDEAAVRLLDAARRRTGAGAAEVDRVLAMLQESGARAAVEAAIARLVAAGARHLDRAALQPAARRRLHGLLFRAAGLAAGPAGGQAGGAPGGSPSGAARAGAAR